MGRQRTAGAARGALRGLRAASSAHVAGDGGAGRARPGDQRAARARGVPADHRRAVRRRQRGDQAGARVPSGARPAGPDRHVGHCDRRLAGRQLRARPGPVGAAAGAGRRLRARRAQPEPLRQADREPGRDLGPGRRRDRGAPRRGPGAAAVRPRALRRGRHLAAPRTGGAADPAAGRPRVHRRRRPAALGPLAAAGLAAPGRGPGAARGHLHRGRTATADPVPRVDVGDGRALRATPARCTRGRTRSTPASGGSGRMAQLARRSAATAWARSATSTTSRPTNEGSRDTLPQRHLHARRGLRDPLEARRPACPGAPRCAGRAGWSSARSPPSATTSTASSGTSTSTGPSSSR